ncbi:MAG: DUF3822 family protein [Chitinophagaceae bacterium]
MKATANESILLMELGEQYCCVAVVKKDGHEAQRLVYYEGENDEQLLDNVITAHSEFKDHYTEVLINYHFPQSVLTPTRHYTYEDGKKMLQLMYGNEKEVAVLSEHLPDWQLYNIYEVPKDVHSWVSMQFHSGKYWHNYTSILKTMSGSEGSNVFMIDFKSGQFSVIVIKEKQLQLVRTFVYTESTDVLYYLLKICESFSISQKTVLLVLSGLIDKNSTLYRDLYNYFQFVSFKRNPDTIRLPYNFTKYPSHFFSSLFNLALCGS